MISLRIFSGIVEGVVAPLSRINQNILAKYIKMF